MHNLEWYSEKCGPRGPQSFLRVSCKSLWVSGSTVWPNLKKCNSFKMMACQKFKTRIFSQIKAPAGLPLTKRSLSKYISYDFTHVHDHLKHLSSNRNRLWWNLIHPNEISPSTKMVRESIWAYSTRWIPKVVNHTISCWWKLKLEGEKNKTKRVFWGPNMVHRVRSKSNMALKCGLDYSWGSPAAIP